MLISRVHYPVTALGFGTRAGIWTQGCTLRCPGCIAQDTWEADPATDIPVPEILAWVAERPALDGVTISGGEPLDQAEALLELVRGLRALLPTGDILCFSGRPAHLIRRRFAAILGSVDALVAGPFLARRPTGHPLMGSANQQLLISSELGQQRYGRLSSQRPSPQVTVTGEHWWLVGIPSPAQITGVETESAATGVQLTNVSWRGDNE